MFGVGNITHNFPVTALGTDTKKEGDIKLISYNVKNFNERDSKSTTTTKNAIIDFISDERSDIVCLQEYHSTSPYLYDPIKKIRDTLNMKSYYYESYFNPKYNQLLGLVTFSKYDAVNKGRLKFDGSRTFGIYTDVIIDKDTVRIFNIHLASIKLLPSDIDFVTNNEDPKELKNRSQYIYYKLTQAYKLRERQLNYLTEVIKSTPYSMLLCGDFNDTPSSWIYRQIINYLNDTFVEKGNGICPTYAGPIPFLRIDYIMVSDDFKTKGFTRFNIHESDHYPISSIIRKH